MSLYYVMIPDNVHTEAPVFTRYGKLCQRLDIAKRMAAKRCGRVFETTGHDVIKVADFWRDPSPEAKRTAAEYRQARANAALFGITI